MFSGTLGTPIFYFWHFFCSFFDNFSNSDFFLHFIFTSQSTFRIFWKFLKKSSYDFTSCEDFGLSILPFFDLFFAFWGFFALLFSLFAHFCTFIFLQNHRDVYFTKGIQLFKFILKIIFFTSPSESVQKNFLLKKFIHVFSVFLNF